MTRFTSHLDGSPTPAWVERLRRRHVAQPAETFAARPQGERRNTPKRDWLRRDWLPTEKEKPWRLK